MFFFVVAQETKVDLCRRKDGQFLAKQSLDSHLVFTLNLKEKVGSFFSQRVQ